MNTQARVIVGVLGAVAVALAVTLGVVIAMDDDDMMADRGHINGDDSYAGMMQSLGEMDSDAMLIHMQAVLGADGYRRMIAHMNDHRTGGPMTGDATIDRMMHSIMDGMMQHMPADANNIMPPGRDEHHETPAATGTPEN
jgi:hypothetical protein